jgi:hypothetical protein
VVKTKAEFACVSVTLPLSKPLHVNIRVAAVRPAPPKYSFNNADYGRVKNLFERKKKNE